MNKILDKESYKYPRLYSESPLSDKGVIPLNAGQAHYLHNVMRRKDGDIVRLFDGKNGEWAGALEGVSKKAGAVRLTTQLNPQPADAAEIHLIFTPIKKSRLDWMIEKAVELGVSDFHPILTQNTEVRKINAPRLTQQIFEAAEQCERFTIPALHSLEKMDKAITTAKARGLKVFSCLERQDVPLIQSQDKAKACAFIIGPEGGFTAEEQDYLIHHTTPISLGQSILRCETAMIKALILLQA